MDISSIVNTDANANTTSPAHAAPNPSVPQSTLLLHAIESANLKRVQTVLREICLACPQAHSLACEKLLVSDSPASDQPSARSSTKRKQRFEICEQCDKEYDVSENAKDACRWHPGWLEADFDGDHWVDHDERCHGPIDSFKDEFPEGFVWDCCDAKGDKPGCEVDVHRPDVKKRAKVQT